MRSYIRYNATGRRNTELVNELNSHLIDLHCICKYVRGEGGQVIMQNGDVIDVARRKKEEFLKIIAAG